MPSCGVCLSSWMLCSVSKRVNIYYSHFFRRLVDHDYITLFRNKRYGNIPTGPLPHDWGVKCRWGVKKIAIFNQRLALSRKWYKIGPQLLWSVDSNSNAIYRMVSFQLSDIEWLSEIFNDAKHCTASLRQLSFLFCIYFSSVHAYATQFRPPPRNRCSVVGIIIISLLKHIMSHTRADSENMNTHK